MAITDTQLDTMVSFARTLGERDRVRNHGRRPASLIVDMALVDMEEKGERTEDEFEAIITVDDMPAQEDRDDIVDGYLKGYFDRESFLDGYIECALWADCQWTEEDQHPSGESGGREHLEPRGNAREEMRERSQMDDFIDSNIRDLTLYCGSAPSLVAGLDEAHAGHDFWLTRVGHGTGFWDRGLGALSDRLTDEAKSYGSADDHIPFDNGDDTFSV